MAYFSKSDADLLLTAPMGGVPGLGLGIALARSDARVWFFNGDGCTLMYLGSLVTIAGLMPQNLVFFLTDNREWARVGHVPLPAAGKVDFAGMARHTGWKSVYSFDSLNELDAAMARIKNEKGPVFVDLKVTADPTNMAGTPYTQKMVGNQQSIRRYGKSGIANIRAHLAKMAASAK